MMIRRHSPLTALAIAALIAACSSGGGSAGIRYYLIDPVEHAPLETALSGPALEIADLQVPQYLERYQIAIRSGENRLYFSDAHQWGENLRKNLIRTLARNLSSLLDTDDVGTPMNRSASTPDYRVQVSLEQFERQTDGRVTLSARWQITEGPTRKPLITERTRLTGERTVAIGDYGATVTEMRELYGQLSRRIAEAIVAVSGERAS